VTCPERDREDPGDIPLDEWQLVAEALESSFVPSEADLQKHERTELLGRILQKSPVVQALRDAVDKELAVSYGPLAERVFGSSTPIPEREEALGALLQLVCGGLVDDQSLLPLRVHFFVKEQR
jgi:hypothetical protein